MAIFKPQTIVAFIGDEHTNSTVGLSAIQVATDDGSAHRASKAQLWIRTCFEDYCRHLEKRVKNGLRRNRLIWVNNGDLVEGVHHNTTQICTSNMAQQLKNAIKTLQPILSLNPNSIYIIRGTEAHSGASGQWDELFARDIRAVPVYEDKAPEDNEFSWYSLLLNIEGVLFDIAHTGEFGMSSWTGVNALNKIAMEAKDYYLSRGERCPDYVIRSHTHRWGASAEDKSHSIKVVSVPSWQLCTSYSYRRKPGRFLDIGGYIFEVDNGRCNYEPVIYQPPGARVCQA